MKQTFVTLNDGNQIPRFGLGVYQIAGDENTKKVCIEALQIGYRHIDTAHAYQNERGVGGAVKESGIPRGEIWVTSKLWPSEYGLGKTMRAIDRRPSAVRWRGRLTFCKPTASTFITRSIPVWR